MILGVRASLVKIGSVQFVLYFKGVNESVDVTYPCLVRDSIVSVTTCYYELDGPGSNLGEGEIFLTRPDQHWGPPNLIYNGYPVIPRGEAAGSWPWPTILSRADVKERLKPFLNSSYVISWQVILCILAFNLHVFRDRFGVKFCTQNAHTRRRGNTSVVRTDAVKLVLYLGV
jgi:hypothetical protein